MKSGDKKAEKAAVIEISAKDWHEHSRNQFWYLGVALLVGAGAYLAFMAGDYLAMTVAVVVGIAVYRVAHLKPTHKTIRLTEHGIDWGGQFLAHHQLRAFWLATAEDRIMVYIERLNSSSTISFIIKPSETKAIATHLSRHLPWHDHKSEPFGERFSRFFRL